MKCLKGFLTAKDKETKKEIPFFVKVRSKDIVVTTPIKIESYLYKTSNDYDLVYEYHGHDYSQYVFKTTRDSTNMQRVMYKLFRDGTMNINLEFTRFNDYTSLSSNEISSIQSSIDSSKLNSFFRIQLPYSVTPKTKIHDDSRFFHRPSPVYSVNGMLKSPMEYKDIYEPCMIFLPINKPTDPNISIGLDSLVLSQVLVYDKSRTTNYVKVGTCSITSQYSNEPIAY